VAAKAPKYKPMIDSLRPLGDVGDVLKFTPAIRKNAESFLLTPEIAEEAEQLLLRTLGGKDDPIDSDKLKKLGELAVLPYPTTVIEWPITDGMRKRRNSVARPILMSALNITHMGVLLHKESPDSTAFDVQSFVRIDDGTCDLAIGSLLMDTRENVDKLPSKPKCVPLGNFYAIPCVSFLIQNFVDCIVDPRIRQSQVDSLVAQLNAEQIKAAMFEAVYVLLGVLPIINSNSGTRHTVVPRAVVSPGLGKNARRKLSRAKFTVISLSDREDVDSEGNITPRKLIAAHKVRGHFKRTKTGVRWWSPHVRGHGELQEREAYIVKP
jgi:hypothetical protein